MEKQRNVQYILHVTSSTAQKGPESRSTTISIHQWGITIIYILINHHPAIIFNRFQLLSQAALMNHHKWINHHWQTTTDYYFKSSLINHFTSSEQYWPLSFQHDSTLINHDPPWTNPLLSTTIAQEIVNFMDNTATLPPTAATIFDDP